MSVQIRQPMLSSRSMAGYPTVGLNQNKARQPQFSGKKQLPIGESPKRSHLLTNLLILSTTSAFAIAALLRYRPSLVEALLNVIDSNAPNEDQSGVLNQTAIHFRKLLGRIVGEDQIDKWRTQVEQALVYSFVSVQGPTPKGRIASMATTPAEAPGWRKLCQKVEEVPLMSVDQTGKYQLKGFYVPAMPGKPTFLFAHGNNTNLLGYGDLLFMKGLTEKGFGFLAFDYRGFGESQGEVGEKNLYQDFKAAKAFLNEDKGIPDKDIIPYGCSLGSALVVENAQNTAFRAVVLACPMTSVPDIGQNIYERLAGKKYSPAKERLHRSLLPEQFNSIDKIDKIISPLLIFHGDKDGLTPIWMGRSLFSHATHAPFKQFVTIVNGHHYEMSNYVEQIVPCIEQFLSQHEPPKPVSPDDKSTIQHVNEDEDPFYDHERNWLRRVLVQFFGHRLL